MRGGLGQPTRHPLSPKPGTVLPDLQELYPLLWEAGFTAAVDWQHRRTHYLEAKPPPNPFNGRRPHSDDLAVARFALAMQDKLAAARAKGRGGWENKLECSNERLTYLLVSHIMKGDPVDVGNFAMFLHQRGEGCGDIAEALYTAGLSWSPRG